MSLTPAASVVLGNLRYDTHVIDVGVSLALLPGVNTAKIHLPTRVEVAASPGDAASLELDGGEGASIVLTGVVQVVQRDLTGTVVLLNDAGASLSALRPAATFERQGAADILRALASQADIPVGSLDLDLSLASYVAHQDWTAAEHVAYLSRLADAVSSIDQDGALAASRWPEGDPEAALRYGREITSYRVAVGPMPRAMPTVVGYGPSGSADAPDALRHTSSVLPSSAPEPGPGAVRRPVAVLRTPGAVATAAQAARTWTSASATRVRADCFLVPSLRPGMVIEIHDLPDDLESGSWMLWRVNHQISADRGGRTSFEGLAAGGAQGLGSLGSAAASLVGGLL